MKVARVLAFLLASVFVGLAGWLYSRESVFRLSDIRVESKDPYLARDIQRKWVELLGRPLFSISLEDLENDIRRQFNVEHIVIKRKWPTTLSIEIREKDPMALRLRGGRLWTLDQNCQEIALMMSPRALPLMDESADGSRIVRADVESLCSAIPELRSFENSQLSWDDVDEIHFAPDRGWSLRCYEKDLEIVLGHRNLFASWKKAALAMEVLTEKGLRPKFLEASFSKRVVFKLESTLPSKLQILKDELDLKELVRRAPLKQSWVPTAR